MNRTRKLYIAFLFSVALAFTAILTPVQVSAVQNSGDYEVFTGEFTLYNVGNTQTRTVNVNNGLSNTSPAALMFRAYPGANVQLEIQINNSPLTTLDFPDAQLEPGHGVWKTFFPVDVNLQPGINTIEFRKIGGAGTIKISDVILLYRRNP